MSLVKIPIPYPQQAYILKAELESAGIEYAIVDELNSLYSDGARIGAKIQVREEDIPAVMRIFESLGYRNPLEDMANPYQELQDFADKIPVLKGVRFELKLGIFVVVVITMVYLVGHFLL